jgi:cellulose synthase (UDP-forming)
LSLDTLRNAPPSDTLEGVAEISPELVFGRNQIQFYFNLKPYDDRGCSDIGSNVRTIVDADSEIDFSRMHRYAQMPNLAYFAQGGFPFTRVADLSETAVVLPRAFTAADVEALLGVMGALGDKTGYPAVRVAVVDDSSLDSVADRDLLVIGPYASQRLHSAWGGRSPVSVEGETLRLRVSSPLGPFQRQASLLETPAQASEELSLARSTTVGMLTSFQSPLKSGRTVVALTADTGADLLKLAEFVRSPARSAEIHGSLVVLTDDKATGYWSASPYYIGALPPVLWAKFHLSRHAWALPALLLLTICLLARGSFLGVRRRAARLEADG